MTRAKGTWFNAELIALFEYELRSFILIWRSRVVKHSFGPNILCTTHDSNLKPTVNTSIPVSDRRAKLTLPKRNT